MAAVKVAVVAAPVAKRIVGHLRCLSYRAVVGHRSRLWAEIYNEPENLECREPHHAVLVGEGMPLAGADAMGWQGDGGLLTYQYIVPSTGLEAFKNFR